MAEENTAVDMDDSEEPLANAEDVPTQDGVGEVDIGRDTPAEPVNESETGPVASNVIPPTHSVGESESTGVSSADISMILDIPVTLSMEIGQTRISISELLKLSKDSVIELQRMADEPMDVLVNGTLVAHGEAVVVGERFGIRLTDVISPQERLSKFT